MNIALTGGTGFIGSHFLKQALAAGHTVRAQRRSPNSKPRIELIAQPLWLDSQLEEVSVDQLSGCDVMVHLATHTGNVPYDTLTNCLHSNLMAVLKLFEQARLAGIKRFIVAGSCFEYGRSAERYEAIPSNAPLEPTNSYAASKAAASIALRQWAEEHRVSLDILRVFHAFGEGEHEARLWPVLRRAALAGDDLPMTLGEQIRDFLPVEGVAFTFLARAAHASRTEIGANIFNLTSGTPISIRSFSEYWWKAWNAPGRLLFGEIPYRHGEVMKYIPGPELLMVPNKRAPTHFSNSFEPNFSLDVNPQV